MTTRKKLLAGISLSILLLIAMGLFSFFKPTQKITQTTTIDPYKEGSINLIYNLLFCDNLDLYKEHTKELHNFPFNVLFSANSLEIDLQKIIDDTNSDPRLKVLAYKKQFALGYKPIKKELLAVIVEIGLDNGLEVLASFNDGSARYINQTEKILVWEATDEKSKIMTRDLFLKSQNIINQIGAWDKPRRPAPTKGNARITFLVSDELYFGEGTIDVLFNDSLARPALMSAAELMRYIAEKSIAK